MLSRIKSFFRTSYQPLNKIFILKENLLSNYRYLSKVNHTIKIAPVLKSNAYGHGIIEVAKILDSQNCPFFCVDYRFEPYQH